MRKEVVISSRLPSRDDVEATESVELRDLVLERCENAMHENVEMTNQALVTHLVAIQIGTYELIDKAILNDEHRRRIRQIGIDEHRRHASQEPAVLRKERLCATRQLFDAHEVDCFCIWSENLAKHVVLVEERR